VAFVELVEGSQVKEEEILEYANEHLAKYKKIRILKIEESLPASLAGKVLRRELRDKAQEMEI
ncbi:MAG: long-chain fatty acid--CoA ligase, partial [Actinobacteria bacterium]|nr:long-chain fatty acid--CoA ligase [Actinomycetota bacterium]